MMRFLAIGLGSEEFGAYGLARRMISTLAPFAILSLDIALVRYIAMTKEKRIHSAYIFSFLFAAGIASLLLVVIAFVGENRLSNLIFNSQEYSELYYASFFFLIGYVLYMITYAYFRGIQKFNKANLMQLIFIAIIPLIVSISFASKKNASFIVFLIGASLYLSLFPLAKIIIKTKLPRLTDIRTSMRTLLVYSLPRVPAGFAFAGLLTLGPYLAGSTQGLEEAGYFVIGQSVFRVMESSIVGFGLVVLPKISQFLANEKTELLSSKIENILILIFQLGLFVSIHIFIWSKEIVFVWLGPDYMKAVPILKIIILSLGPYLGYVMLRSIIDAVDVRAVNTLNLFLSLVIASGVSIASIFLGFGIIGLAVGTTTGFFALGILTSSYLMKRYRIEFKNFMLPWVIALNVLFAGIIYFTKMAMANLINQNVLLILGFIIESVLFFLYLFFFYKMNIGWIAEIKSRILTRSFK